MPLSLQTQGLDFSQRIEKTELMDLPCAYEDFRDCLRDVDEANLVTLGYRPTFKWFDQLALQAGQALHIVDVGSGRADMLRRLGRRARRQGLTVKLTAIDLNPHAARAGREKAKQSDQIHWVTGDAFSYQPDIPIDIIISSLFTHHLADEELVSFLRWMESHAQTGWFINDLHREQLPFHLFRVLAWFARWHRFVQHDGPLSIQRGFRDDDWRRLLAEAGISQQTVQIETFRPGRLCVGRRK